MWEEGVRIYGIPRVYNNFLIAVACGIIDKFIPKKKNKKEEEE